MSCDEIKSRLGEWFDGELPAELRPAVQRHLDACPICRSEYEWLQRLAVALAKPPEGKLPPGLWEAIEQRLDETQSVRAPSAPSEPPTPSTPSAPYLPSAPRRWFYRLARRPLAAAAVVVLTAGLGWLALNGPWESHAEAGQIDFRPLLAQADGDLGAGIRALMRTYGGEPISLADAARRMKVRIHAPDQLPGGLHLESRYLLNMGGHHQALAFHYTEPGGGHLLLLQCPPDIEKNYGNYECVACSVGDHAGHGVQVGKLHLMHLMSENVCVCVVSTLGEQRDLPATLAAVQIDF